MGMYQFGFISAVAKWKKRREKVVLFVHGLWLEHGHFGRALAEYFLFGTCCAPPTTIENIPLILESRILPTGTRQKKLPRGGADC